jgi:plasmid stabilization system protein ParE
MAARRVVWTDDADQEKEEILRYWTERNRSKSYSRKLNQRIKVTAKKLGHFPNVGKLTQVEDVRILLVENYAMYYYIDVDLIHILSIRDNRRNPAGNPF